MNFRAVLFSFVVACGAFAAGAGAQPVAMPAEVVERIKVEQNLDAQVPPDLVFRNEAGEEVRLGDYFGKRPIVLSLVYYDCPGLCTMTLNGMVKSFRPLEFDVGDEFEVITVSFDPKEKPELAAAKKAEYVKQYRREGAERGWHFLTGDPEPIKALCETVGFGYSYDERTGEYAHASVIMVLTPTGKVSRYFYGLEYSSRDLRLGLIEASEERIGSLSDAVMLLCYKYDPTTGKYGFVIMTVLRAGAILTVLGLGLFMFVMFRRDRRLGRRVKAEG